MSTALLETQPAPEEAATEHTPEELLHLTDGHLYELIDGKLVERHMGAESGVVT